MEPAEMLQKPGGGPQCGVVSITFRDLAQERRSVLLTTGLAREKRWLSSHNRRMSDRGHPVLSSTDYEPCYCLVGLNHHPCAYPPVCSIGCCASELLR